MLCVLSAAALAAAPLDIDQPLRTGATAPTDSAVVIGLENYAYVASVPFARRDAQSFHDFLVYAKGVPLDKVRLLQTASAKMIERAVSDAAADVGEGGTLWVYYAGHGAASASDGGRLLLADDVRQDPVAFEDSAVRVDDLQRIAENAGVRAVLVLDTCYSGLGRSGDALVTGKRFAVPSWAAEPPANVTVWTAASGDELSGAFDAARHGSFTYFAVGALRGWADGELNGQRDGTVTRAEAQAYVSRALRSIGDRSQTPSLQGAMDEALAVGVAEEGPDLQALRPSAPEPAVVVAPPVESPPTAAVVPPPVPQSSSTRWAVLAAGGKAVQAYGPLDIGGERSYIFDNGDGCISQLESTAAGWRETMLIGASCTPWTSITVEPQGDVLTLVGDGQAIRLERQPSSEGGLAGEWRGSFYVERQNAVKALGAVLGSKGPAVSQNEVPIELSITAQGGATHWPRTTCHGTLDLSASGRDFSQFKERNTGLCLAGATITVYLLTGQSVLVQWIAPGSGPTAFGILHRAAGP